MYVMRIPYRYMAEDATPDDKAIYEYYKGVLADIQNGTQRGLIMPSDRDPETRQHLFELEWIADTDKL